VTKNIAIIAKDLVTPNAADKQELLFNKLASEAGLFNIQVRLKKHNKV
jgi:hypothetical protein